MLNEEPIVILGMFRSGTSCVATAFSELGVHFGSDNDLFPADEFNPGGYFEMRDLMMINRRCLAAFGMQHFQVEAIPDAWAEVPGNLALVQEIRKILNNRFQGQERWGWKEPQTSVLMPLYRELAKEEGLNPHYVICVRNPLDVASSQRTHGPLPMIGARVVGLWLHYTLSALRGTRGAPRTVFMYERFLEDPRAHLESAMRAFGTWKPSAAQMDRAVASVRPEWRHGRTPVEDLAQWPALVADVFELSRAAAVDAQGLNAGAYDDQIEGLWDRWAQSREMVKASSMPASRMILSWQVGGEQKRQEERMSPTGGWQTVSIDLDAPPATPIHIDPYQTPCQLWIRNAHWMREGKQTPAILKPGPHGFVDELFDCVRVTVFGPDPLMVQAPPGSGLAQLNLELLVQVGPTVVNDIIAILRAQLDHARRRANSQSNWARR